MEGGGGKGVSGWLPSAHGVNSGDAVALSGPGPDGQRNQAFVMRAKNELSGATIRFLFLPDPRGLEGLTLFACSKEEGGEGPQGRKGHDVSPWGLGGTRSASVNCLPGCSSFPKEGTPVAAPAQATRSERKVVILIPLGYKAAFQQHFHPEPLNCFRRRGEVNPRDKCLWFD